MLYIYIYKRCTHCEQMKPDYIMAAKELRNQNPPVYLAKVDATMEMKLGKRFNIPGYPTLKFSSQNHLVDYSGGRFKDEIV